MPVAAPWTVFEVTAALVTPSINEMPWRFCCSSVLCEMVIVLVALVTTMPIWLPMIVLPLSAMLTPPWTSMP